MSSVQQLIVLLWCVFVWGTYFFYHRNNTWHPARQRLGKINVAIGVLLITWVLLGRL